MAGTVTFRLVAAVVVPPTRTRTSTGSTLALQTPAGAGTTVRRIVGAPSTRLTSSPSTPSNSTTAIIDGGKSLTRTSMVSPGSASAEESDWMAGLGSEFRPLMLTGSSPLTVARTVAAPEAFPRRRRVRARPLSSVGDDERVTSPAP